MISRELYEMELKASMPDGDNKVASDVSPLPISLEVLDGDEKLLSRSYLYCFTNDLILLRSACLLTCKIAVPISPYTVFNTSNRLFSFVFGRIFSSCCKFWKGRGWNPSS